MVEVVETGEFHTYMDGAMFLKSILPHCPCGLRRTKAASMTSISPIRNELEPILHHYYRRPSSLELFVNLHVQQDILSGTDPADCRSLSLTKG